MTDRIIRRSRAAPPQPAPRAAAAPLRVARRTDIPEAPQRTTATSTHQGRATVSETVQDEVMPRSPIPDGSAFGSVRVGVGKTVNTGNYSAVRIDVSVTLPFIDGEEHLAYRDASDFVHDKLAEEEAYVLGSVEPRRSANRRG